MPEAEFAALVADIRANGLRDHGWMYEGKVLDGWHRYRACQIAGRAFRTETYMGSDPEGFVESKNLHRRHLTFEQRMSHVQAELARDVLAMLEQSRDAPLAPGFPKALIVPHAGYIYSGQVAANAFALLRPGTGVVKRVVLLGPCHRVAVTGLALPGAAGFETPLGTIPVDEDAVRAIADLPQVVSFPATHAREHSLEVQLPFLQQILREFTLVPLVVGAANAGKSSGIG